MKRGFSLVELMIVIGIIGVLMSILLVSVSGSSDSARAAKCLANMHTLAAACHSVGMSENYYPRAGACEKKNRQFGKPINYSEVKGWISWASGDAYGKAGSSTTPRASGSWFTSTYEKSKDVRQHALTNGTIWRAIGGNASSYFCPHHARLAKDEGVTPVWSYVMNSFFGWAGAASPMPLTNPGGVWFESLERGDRRLLLAELPFNKEYTGQKCTFTTGSGIGLDCTLQYEEPFNEVLGVNHKSGKKWFAHVCFADGHAEKIEIPSGTSNQSLRELTTLLCGGKDYTLSGNKYEELK